MTCKGVCFRLCVDLAIHKNAQQISTMKVAAAQISCVLGERAANLGKVCDFAAHAKRAGAELIVFPEMIDTGYSMPTIKQHAAAWKEGAAPELQKIAKELGLGIVCGISDRDGESIYNAQVFVDATGEIVAEYRKTHLVTAAPLGERFCFSAGDEIVCSKSAFLTDSPRGEIDRVNR